MAWEPASTTPSRTSSGLEQEIAWAKRGANLIVHSADIIAFRLSMRADIGRLRRELGDA